MPSDSGDFRHHSASGDGGAIGSLHTPHCSAPISCDTRQAPGASRNQSRVPRPETLLRWEGMVGAAGFEPTTSCPPDKRANQAAPRSDPGPVRGVPQGPAVPVGGAHNMRSRGQKATYVLPEKGRKRWSQPTARSIRVRRSRSSRTRPCNSARTFGDRPSPPPADAPFPDGAPSRAGTISAADDD